VNACKTALKIIKEETGHILGHLREGWVWNFCW
jgi:molybdenum cofactor biosynthesis protein B